MAILKSIDWSGESKDTILYKYPFGAKDQINSGSALTVREGQVAIFLNKGKLADVFEPGFYKLDTDSLPVLTKLLSWKYGFNNPFKTDIYYVNTKMFIDFKWGTSNPIILRDSEYGAVRIRAYGTYSFKIIDAYKFMSNITGQCSHYSSQEICDFMRGILLSGMTTALGESSLSILDMAANVMAIGELVEKKLCTMFDEIGIEITNFNIQSFTLPESLEQALDQSTSLTMLRKNIDVYQAKGQTDALKAAAENTGSMGSFMNAGIGMSMGQTMVNNLNKNTTEQNQVVCPECNTPVKKGAKFCGECGAKLKPVCKKCGKVWEIGDKFCRDCGTKL